MEGGARKALKIQAICHLFLRIRRKIEIHSQKALCLWAPHKFGKIHKKLQSKYLSNPPQKELIQIQDQEKIP